MPSKRGAPHWSDDEDAVGHKRPPKWTRFPPGTSGNPKGRPRKKAASPQPSVSEADDLLRTVLECKHRFKDSDGIGEATGHELLYRAQMQSAIKGHPMAQRDLTKAARDLETRDAARRLAEEVATRQTFDKIVRYRALREREWNAAEQAGGEPADPWPHPDDIVLNHRAQTWTVRGPFDGEDLLLFEYFRAQRDRYFLRSLLGFRDRPICPLSRAGVWDVIWRSFDLRLPLRWQIASGSDILEFGAMCVIPLRKLRDLAEAAAREAELLRVRMQLSAQTRESYQVVNQMLKPLLQSLGYKSLAQFQHGSLRWSRLLGQFGG